MLDLLLLAAKISLPTNDKDIRDFWLGCVGIRRDGAMVFSKNGAVYSTKVDDYQLIPSSHAEGRILKKLDRGSIIYVARVKRRDKTLAMASPCGMCRVRIRGRGVKKVFYTINENQYGVWFVKENIDKVYTCAG
jgi:cytidine deaminase